METMECGACPQDLVEQTGQENDRQECSDSLGSSGSPREGGY